jgi:purine-nucleoside phosphorylase
MNKFNSLFGIDVSDIKKTCVIMPFISKEAVHAFEIQSLSKGGLYSVGDNGLFTLIHTGVGPTFVGDAALYLEDTRCENIILFGSCGATRDDGGFNIGDIGIVKKALSQDSFTNMLFKRKAEDRLYPDEGFYSALSSPGGGLKEINCLTVGSLKLEQEYLDFIEDNSIDAVDMEAASFFAACKNIKKRGIAVLFATDSLKSLPYYMAMKSTHRPVLNKIVKESSLTLCKLIKERLKG